MAGYSNMYMTNWTLSCMNNVTKCHRTCKRDGEKERHKHTISKKPVIPDITQVFVLRPSDGIRLLPPNPPSPAPQIVNTRSQKVGPLPPLSY